MPGISPVHAAAKMSRSKRTWSVSVGVKAVKSWVPGEGGGAGVERVAVDPVAPPQGPALLEGIATGARRGSGSGRRRDRASRRASKRRVGLGARAHDDVARQHRVQPAGEAVGDLAAASKLATCAVACTPASVRPATVRATSLAEDLRERGLELTLDRALAGLRGPAAEAGSVVGDLEAVAGQTELEEDHLGRVRAARAELDDPRVAARALGVARSHFLEELVDHELVLAEVRERLPARVQVAPLAERDQLLDLGLHRLRLRLARLDPLVLDHLDAEVAEQRLAVRGVAAELVAGLAMAHGVGLVVSRSR